MHKNIIFVVVGRLGKNLVASKALPIIKCRKFSKVYIFSEEYGIQIPGADYIILPSYIKKIKPLFIRRILRLIYEPLQLIYYSYKLKPKIIHGFYTLPKGLNSLIASKFINCYCIISVIGGKEEIETAFFIRRYSRNVIIALLKKADFVTTKGENDNLYLLDNGILKRKIKIFNGAIDTNRFNYNNEEKDIDILFAGHFNFFKGPQRALEIIKEVIKKRPNTIACFIGNGPLYPSIVDEANRTGLHQMKFMGHVENSEEYFKRSKILVFPSSNEGLSTAMLEAMACQCVPITSDVGNQREAAINKYNSVVIDSCSDLESFTKAILELLNNQDTLKRFAINGQNTINAKYSIEAQSSVCNEIYNLFL